MRRVPVVGVVVLAVLLDLHLTRWAATHPFLFALAGALLAVPLTALITDAVVDALLSAHEWARVRRVYEPGLGEAMARLVVVQHVESAVVTFA